MRCFLIQMMFGTVILSRIQQAKLEVGKKFRLSNLKGHSQLCDRADLDTSFVSFEKRLPQPKIKGTRQIHLEICFNLPIVLLDFQSFTGKLFMSMLLLIL